MGTRVTPRREISTHPSNATKANAVVVASALVTVKTGMIWMMTKKGTKLMTSIDRNMNVQSGAIRRNTKPNRGTKNALGLLVAPALNVPNHRSALARVTMVKVSSIHRNSAGRKNARDVVNALVRALQQSRQRICDVTTHAIP